MLVGVEGHRLQFVESLHGVRAQLRQQHRDLGDALVDSTQVGIGDVELGALDGALHLTLLRVRQGFGPLALGDEPGDQQCWTGDRRGPCLVAACYPTAAARLATPAQEGPRGSVSGCARQAGDLGTSAGDAVPVDRLGDHPGGAHGRCGRAERTGRPRSRVDSGSG